MGAPKRRYRIVGQLGSNRRLAAVSERAALLYLVALPYGDREGRLPGLPDDLIDEVCPALARRHGWTGPEIEAAIAELVAADLWSTWISDDGVVVIGIQRWTDHQHPSKLAEERPSRLPAPPSHSLPETKEKGSESNRRTEPNGTERNPSCPTTSADGRSNDRDSWYVQDERLRILRACQLVGEESGRPWYPNLDVEAAIQRYADSGACRQWASEAALVTELRRVRAGAAAKGLRQAADVAWLLRKVGSVWSDPVAAPQLPLMLGPVLVTVTDARRELEEIRASETPESRARVRAMIAEAKRKLPRRSPEAPGETIEGAPARGTADGPDRGVRPLAGAVEGFLGKLEVRAELAAERLAEDAAGTVPIEPAERVVRELARRAAS